MNAKLVALYALIISFSLVACGGGGSDSNGGDVGDTTAPIVSAPANISVAADSASGTQATNSTIATFLNAASATDDVDGSVSVTNNAPSTFSAGSTTTVTFSAVDNAGNIGTATATVTVDSFISASSWVGTKQNGVLGAFTYGNSLATDSSGNVFVVGQTSGELDGNTLTGYSDLFVSKYNDSGEKQFTELLGLTVMSTSADGVATDINGNVYVVGSTQGGLDGNTQTGVRDFFVTKYDSSGVKQYTKQLGVSLGSTNGTAVATDPFGNVYVGGDTSHGLDGNTQVGFPDAFFTKYDSDGVKLYTKQLGVTGEGAHCESITTDSNGNVYIAGYTTGGLDGNALTGINDLFVTKYNSVGVKQYTLQLGVASQNVWAYSIATDVNDNIYVAGSTTGGLDGNTLTGYTDFFVTKYNSAGTKQYTKQLGVAAGSTFGTGVATDSNGNVYVTGYTNIGLDGNAQVGTQDFFVTKFDNTGSKQYTKQLGTAGSKTYSRGIAIDANGGVYITGYTDGGLDGNVLTGTRDYFITKYDSAGVKQ